MLNKILKLERNLGVLDLETTGLNPDIDRIVQMALTIHYPHRDPISWSSLINPEIPILNSDKHNIRDLDIAVCQKCRQEAKYHPKDDCPEFAPAPTFKQVAKLLAPKILNIDICGYNVNFDIGFMKAEMKRAGIDWPWSGHIVDPFHIYKMRQGHTLTNAYIRYVDPKGFENAHDAANDVRATELVLRAQLLEYNDLPRTVKELSDFCFPHPENAVDKTGKFIWLGKDVAFNFGKHRGKLLKDPVCRPYLKWLSGADFPDDVKEIATDALMGIYPEKENG